LNCDDEISLCVGSDYHSHAVDMVPMRNSHVRFFRYISLITRGHAYLWVMGVGSSTTGFRGILITEGNVSYLGKLFFEENVHISALSDGQGSPFNV
jgi:hypothetical protein